MGATLATVAVLTHIRGLGAVGVWGLVMSAVALVGTVGDVGLGTVTQRVLASGDCHAYRVVRRVALTWLGGLIFALMAVGALMETAVSGSANPWSQLGAIGVPVAILVSARAAEKFFSDLARARSRQLLASLVGWQGATLATGAGSLLALFAGWRPDVGDFVAWHAAWAGLGVVALALAERRASSTTQGAERTGSLDGVRVFREGAAISAAHLSNFLQQGADVWVLGILVGDSEVVGIYYLASRIASLVSLPLAATLQWSQPHLARSLGRVSLSDRRAITTATKFAAVSAAALGGVVTLLAGAVYEFLTSGSAPGGFVILIGVFAAGHIIDAVTGPVGYGLMLQGQAMFLVGVNAILGSAAVLAMLALALVPVTSSVAIAVVVSVTVASRSLIAERRFAQLTEYSPLMSLLSPRGN